MFEKINNRSITNKLGCMTSVNIWQDCVVYDELTINERQKKDQAFSSMLDEVRRGCPSQTTLQALKERIITTSTVDKFEELLSTDKSPLCLFPTREACQNFNSEMLSKLGTKTKEIPCVDEVDETQGTFKWSDKAKEALKKMNSDCNLTAGLEAVLQVAVGARVMLRRNIDVSSGLVNGAVGTVIAIKAHHITVQFDGRPEPHNVERVRSKFMLLKKVYVHRKQFPLILAFAVTVHKCQGLSLDCAIMDLSEQVFCPGMAYVALSRVKQLENLHLIAFHEEAIKVSSKCLQEINRLRQTYRPDLPQYTVPRQCTTQTRKRKLAGSLSTTTTSETPSAKRSKRSAVKRKAPAPAPSQTPKVEGAPPVPKRKRVAPPPPPPPPPPQTAPPGDGKCNKKGAGGPKGKAPPPRAEPSTSKCAVKRGIKFVSRVPPCPILPNRRYNPLNEAVQHDICARLGLKFVRANECEPGGADVVLKPPTLLKSIGKDGNCLFRSLSYAITGSESQHSHIRCLIVHQYRTEINCWRLMGNYFDTYADIDDYLQTTGMAEDGVWGQTQEMIVFAYTAGVNIASYNADDGSYQMLCPTILGPDIPVDDARPTIYLAFTGSNHFQVVLSQD